MKNASIYRADAVLLFAILLVVMLYYGRIFLIPFTLGIFLAMLMLPVCRKLETWGVKRGLAVFLCILMILLFIGAAFAIITAQAVSFSEDLPQVQTKMQQLFGTIQQWVQAQFNIAPKKQIEMMKQGLSNFSQSANKSITGLLSGFMGILTDFALVLVYMFFLLWKREKYENFFLRLVSRESQAEARETIGQISKVASQYLGGRLISMLFLAVLNGVGFLVIGLQNALLLALISVIPTIIPYIGPIIGGFFPILMALVHQSPSVALAVLVIVLVTQAIDNYFIEPFVVGSSVDVSPFLTIVGIVAGEMVWGITGMVLFIPLLAMVKIVCDHVPALHPYGYLLGDESGEPEWMKKIKGWLGKGKK